MVSKKPNQGRSSVAKLLSSKQAAESIVRRKRENYRNQRQVINLLKEAVAKEKPKLSLEVGCGDGYFSEMVSEASSEVIASDIKKNIANYVLKKANITFQLADGTNLPFKAEKFDLVYSIDVIEHLEKDKKFIDENLRVLKKNGLLIIVTPNKNRLSNMIKKVFGLNPRYPLFLGRDFVGEEVVHIREYREEELIALIKKSKYKTDQCKIFGCYLGFSGNFGFETCPRIFKNYCGSWFLVLNRK